MRADVLLKLSRKSSVVLQRQADATDVSTVVTSLNTCVFKNHILVKVLFLWVYLK